MEVRLQREHQVPPDRLRRLPGHGSPPGVGSHRSANTELGRLLRFHGDVNGLAALTDDNEFALAAYFDIDGQEDFVSQGDNALTADIQNVRALTQDLLSTL